MKKQSLILLCLGFLLLISYMPAFGQESDPENDLNGELPSAFGSDPEPNTLYAHSFSSSSSLYVIDETSGVATYIGNIGFSNITDVAFRGNVLYGITFSQFVRINPYSGAGTLIGNINYGNMNALAVSRTGVFYAASTDGRFYNINEETGKGLLIGYLGTGLSSSGDLAFDGDGVLYATLNKSGSSSDWLAKINLQTGSATLIGPIGFSAVYGLSFLDGLLYGAASNGNVILIDKSNGTGKLIGDNTIVFGGMTTSPEAIPSYYLPYDYSTSSFLDEIRDTELGGRVSSYFDHQYPTYNSSPNTGCSLTGCVSTDYKAVNYQGYDGGNNSAPPFNIAYNGHDGIDFALPHNPVPDVLVIASGTVIEVGYNEKYAGHFVTVEHAGGYRSSYWHLASVNAGITKGAIVTRNAVNDSSAVIGKMGDTGNAKDHPHIHLVVRNKEGIVVDPFGWDPLFGSAWANQPDPWAKYNAALGKDGASHYLWNTELKKSQVLDPNVSTSIFSPQGALFTFIPAGYYDYPLRFELRDIQNSIKIGDHNSIISLFFMAYVDNVTPVPTLTSAAAVAYPLPAVEIPTEIDPENYMFLLWDETTENWKILNTIYSQSSNMVYAWTNELGLFTLVDKTQFLTSHLYLPTMTK